MFKKLRWRIYFNVAVLPMIFVFIVTITGGIFTTQYLSRTFDNTVYNAAKLSQVNFKSRLSVMDNEVEMTARNASIKTFVSSGEQEALAMVQLQSLSSSEFFIGATIYSINNNYLLTSPEVSNPPLCASLKNTAFMQEFLSNKSISASLWLRFENIASSYQLTRYAPTFGIVSIVTKIYNDEDRLIGFVLADLNSEHLYSNYFSFEDYQHYLGNTPTFFSQDSQKFLRSVKNEDYADDFTFSDGEIIERYSYNNSRYTFKLTDHYYLTMIFTNHAYNREVMTIIISLLILNLLHGLIVFVLAKRKCKKIVTPLEDLQEKMHEN